MILRNDNGIIQAKEIIFVKHFFAISDVGVFGCPSILSAIDCEGKYSTEENAMDLCLCIYAENFRIKLKFMNTYGYGFRMEEK